MLINERKSLPSFTSRSNVFAYRLLSVMKQTTADRDGNKSRIPVIWRGGGGKGRSGYHFFCTNYNNSLTFHLT